MHIALILVSGVRSEAGHTVARLGRAALESGHQVSIFCAGDGTAHLDALSSLRESGARVIACSADAAIRGWDRPGTPGRGSFVALGDMAADADRLLVF